ncbi:MAG: ammonium transporter, partial [Actinomycetota bacterium]|nr:ammonium transporter [Actinomycetota bacterium]
MRTSKALKYVTALGAGVVIPTLFVGGTVFADEEGLAAAAAVQATLDNVWILVAAVLVIFMQAG